MITENRFGMPTHTWLIAAVALFVVGCGESTKPTPEPDAPAVPIPNSPSAELPSESEFMTTDRALLSNFSPELASAPGLVQNLNKLETSLCLDFRVPSGRSSLIEDGEPCPPTTIQYQNWYETTWKNLTRATASPCFRDLGSKDGNYYYISRNPASWMVADVNARLAGGSLTSINSQPEQDYLFDKLKAWNPTANVWIGLTDVGRTNNNWFWRSEEPLVYQHWYPGEPNNSGGGEMFVHILNFNQDSQGRWNDSNAARSFYYIMKTSDPFHGDDDDAPRDVLVTQDGSQLYLRGVEWVTNRPYIERRVYWKKIFHETLGANSHYSQTHTYKVGTSATVGLSFGFAIRVTNSVDWEMAKSEIESEFHMDFKFEYTVTTESTRSEVFACDVPDGKTAVFALWQLRERFVICDANGDPWTDSAYVLDKPLPYFDQGTERKYLQTVMFAQ